MNTSQHRNFDRPKNEATVKLYTDASKKCLGIEPKHFYPRTSLGFSLPDGSKLLTQFILHYHKMRKQLVAIFITVLLDLIGLGIVVPIAAPLLLRPGYDMLPFYFSFGQRSLILGFLLGIYSVAQFFGAPILGTLADKYGRKKMLILSIGGTCISYFLFAFGIIKQDILLCFASRVLDGFTGGNISIAMSAISDISEEKDRSKNFGLIGVSFGLGFVLGPFIGGLLTDQNLVRWFSFSTPYWFAGILSIINILLLQFSFKETLRTRNSLSLKLFSGFTDLRKAMRVRNMRLLFVVLFLMVFGFNFFTQFFQVFLIHKFNFTAIDIAYLFAYIGLWLAITQGLINRPLSKKYKPATLIDMSAILCALTFPFLLIPGKVLWIYFIVPFVALFNGINTPNLTAEISLQMDSTRQGSILGIRQSILSVAMAIPPILAGIITVININLPIWSATFCTLSGWILFKFVFLKQKRGMQSNKSY